MSMKSISLAIVCAVFTTASLNTGAAIINNGTYTTDTTSGLDWLDLTETTSMSYNDVTAQFGTGGTLEGWRYATENDIVGFFDAFGGNSLYYDGQTGLENEGVFDALAPFWGDTSCVVFSCTYEGQRASNFIYDGSNSNQYSSTYGLVTDNNSTNTPQFATIHIARGLSLKTNADFSSALVRDVSTVPVPAAVWLFGSGLLGLIGVARRKNQA